MYNLNHIPTHKRNTFVSSKASQFLDIPAPLTFFTDKDWTKEETDNLFNVVREYDTRWYVVHDRYEPPPDGPTRSLEVKHNSLCSCTALTFSRISRTDTTAFAENSFGIDLGQGMRRVKLSFSTVISLTKVRDSYDSVVMDLIALMFQTARECGKTTSPASKTVRPRKLLRKKPCSSN